MPRVMTWWKKTSNQMLLAMALGIILGSVFGKRMAAYRPFGDLFIVLLQMAAIPLIFFNVVTAIAKLPDFGTMRRMGIIAMAYYIITMACAGAIGIFVMSSLDVGAGFTLEGVQAPERGTMPSWTQVLLNMFPNNAVAAFAEGELLQEKPPKEIK